MKIEKKKGMIVDIAGWSPAFSKLRVSNKEDEIRYATTHPDISQPILHIHV